MKSFDSSWPVLHSYPQTHLSQIAMPLGGIGTGTISLGGRGNLRDWEIVNRPAKGFDLAQGRKAGCLFLLWTREAGGRTTTRVLEGPIPEHQYEGGHGARPANHMLPRFRCCTFQAAYPLGQVVLTDPEVPLAVRLEAFNPLIPADPDASGIPIAVLRYVLTNKSSKPVSASVCGTLPNFIGADGVPTKSKAFEGFDNYEAQARDNYNTFRKERKLQGLLMESRGIPALAPQSGTLALVTTAQAGVTFREAWEDQSWGNSLLDFWDDFSTDGKLQPRPRGNVQDPRASLAVSLTVPPKSQKSVTFLIAWHFPNRVAWAQVPGVKISPQESGSVVDPAGPMPNYPGNYYCTQYKDAWDVAARTVAALPKLEAKTVHFVRSFCQSDLPQPVKEAALFNLSTLRTETCFRTADGRFYGWEGCHDLWGSCHGSCTHVWNYEQTTAFMFGSLAMAMRDVEFNHATEANGHMRFRVALPLDAPDKYNAAADGQMGTLMRLYREWQLSGDDEFLKSCWPAAQRALAYCWIPGGWDGDQDGVMEGPQHNTMDVEYFGPNPEMGFWYLGALRAMEEMARYLGDTALAQKCCDLCTRGSHWMDANLFNGQYYEHHIVPPEDPSAIPPRLITGMGSRDFKNPILQLGAGCLADQLVGQTMAHICGLGDLADRGNMATTLQSLLQYNFKSALWGHFNHLRTYALNDEAGLLVCTYPLGRRPKFPFPYCNEVWSGFEYSAATEMIYSGRTADALKIIRTVRSRHDGKKRSPFNEPECGHHYTRAMAAWGPLIALTGFHYSAVTGTLTFALPAQKKTRWFWSSGHAWGTVEIIKKSKTVAQLTLATSGGKLPLRSIALTGLGIKKLPAPRIVGPNTTLRVDICKI